MHLSPKKLLLASTFATLVVVPSLFAATDAQAQAVAAPPGALTNYPTCTTKPTAQDSEAAHSAYLLGKRFFEESDYTSASHNFIDAFKLDCSKPELLLNIARANELLGNRPEAVHALETYLARGTSLGPDERAQLQRRIDNLKAAIAAQTPVAPPVPTVVVAPVPTVVTPPPPPETPPPPATEDRKHTVTPWVVFGVGVVAAAAGGALFFVGNNKESGCSSSGSCPTSQDVTNAKNGSTLKSAGAGVFWGGLVVAGGGLLWHFLEPTGPAKTDAPPKAGASFTPLLGPGMAGLGAVGSF